MNSYFNKPSNFDLKNENKSEDYIKASDLKNKALEEIEYIDSMQYTDESLKRRDDLVELINKCNRLMMLQSYKRLHNVKLSNPEIENELNSFDKLEALYNQKNKSFNSRLVRSNIDDISNSTELLEMLYNQNSIYNNMSRDKKSIEDFLNSKKNKKYENFMYEESSAKNNVNSLEVQRSVDSSKSSDAFIISDAGNKPQNVSDVNYRITLRNSNSLNNEDILAFIQTFKNEALKREIYVRCKVLFEQSDGIIFYVDKDNLLETAKLLEDLKDTDTYGEKVTNAIKNFGNPQPFSATLNDNSYYSIAMHGVKPESSRLKSTLGGGLAVTFNGYMDECLRVTYNKLLKKYDNDINKINVNEFYKEMITYHANRMGVGEAIPLWMNDRMYDDLNSKSHLL